MSSFEMRKDLFAIERNDDLNEIGKGTIRQDILGHVTGRSPYFDDHLFDGLLHLRCVRSPHHHARIGNIDTGAAATMPGVRRIIRPEDVPHNINTLLSLIGFGRDDEALLQGTKVAYKGEAIVAVVAETERQARDAVAKVRVDYEVLPHVFDVEEALAPDAPIVNEEYPNNTFDYHDLYDHQKLRFGDTESAMTQADHIIEAEYQMSPIEQAPTETCGAIAAPEMNDRYVCYTSTQALFFSLGTTAKLLDLPSSRLHFIGGTVGGGFGGKVDSLHEPLAVLGAMLTGAPVKFSFDRAEEMQVGAPRGGERWRIRDGVMNDGRIIAREFTGFFDSGAYTRLSSYAIVKGTGHLPGPYTIPNVSSNVYCVYTNRTPATAMRGFGITGVDFAIECHMDKVAEAVGMNPIDLRILNAYRDGDMKAHRRAAKNCALVECCQVAAEKGSWPISAESSVASSLTGGERTDIPETVTDQVGKIGERRRSKLQTEPGAGASVKNRLAAGVQNDAAIAAAHPQDEDMIIDSSRTGYIGPTSSSPTPPPAQSRYQAPPRAATPPPQQPEQPARPSYSPPVQPTPTSTGTPSSSALDSESPSRPIKRPGASRFISGTRRR